MNPCVSQPSEGINILISISYLFSPLLLIYSHLSELVKINKKPSEGLSQEQEPVNSYFPWALGLAIQSSSRFPKIIFCINPEIIILMIPNAGIIKI